MKKLGVLLIQIFVTILGIAQEERAYPMKQSSLLWKIEGPNVQGKCYLFGTIHMIDADLFYFPSKLSKILKGSEHLVMEIGNVNKSDALKHIMLDSGSFFDYFSDAQEDTILVWAKKVAKMEPEQFRKAMDKMKPFAAVQMATQLSLTKPIESYEMTIQSIAKSENIPTSGLETIEQQLGFFDKMSTEEMSEFVMGTIRDFDKSDSLSATMNKIYLDQNVDALYAFMTNAENGLSAEKQRILLDDRNADWIAKIETFIKEKSTFIAVGAGHLGGPNGLIRLLEKQGYTLTAIKI